VQAIASPDQPAAQRRWIEEHRGPRNALDPSRPHAVFVEEECSHTGEVVPVLTVFLTNRECPWRCLMCDLWKNTLIESVAPGMIPAQIDYALERERPHSQQLKLYNSGSFFDHRAIPKEDHAEIASRLRQFSRVILECHPKLVSDEVLRFRDLLGTELEIAMGLETANPDTLTRLNKGMTLDDFANATQFLRNNDIGVRAFILLKPPWTSERDGVEWTRRSIDFAFDAGVNVACVIPTRPGNGALDALAARGEFSPPRLASLEESLDYGIGLKRGRVFADLWDLQLFSNCAVCFDERRARLHAMNLAQRVLPPVSCPACES
jgi:archaeosine synthase beta-subunit